MAYNPNVPAPANLVQDDIAAMRENFQHLDPLAQAVGELQTVSGLASVAGELQTVSGLAPVANELQAVSGLAPYITALLSSRIVEHNLDVADPANGYYVRWQNGLQICVLTGTVGVSPLDVQPNGSGTFRWFYPAQFARVDCVLGTARQPTSTPAGRIVTTDSDPALTYVDGVRYNSDAQAPVVGGVVLAAIGRWQ